MTNNLVPDSFISSLLERPAFRVKQPNDIMESWFASGADSFAYAKIGTSSINQARQLTQAGFEIVDTSVQLERKSLAFDSSANLQAGYEVREADNDDRSLVEAIAATSFVFTRFHLDPMISNNKANELKRQWAGNYFIGKRGEWMIVACYNGKPVGFLQLLNRNETIVIDLVAVAREHQGKNLATAMIQHAAISCGNFERMLVGTQVANTPSLRAYERLGFRVCDSSYVFHYHGPIQASDAA